MVDARFADVLIVYFHRKGAVAFSDQKRSAEIGKRTHKYHEGGGKYGRHAQRQYDRQKSPPAGASHICGSFEQRIVDVFQRARNIEKHERKEFCRQHEQDPLKSVDVRHYDIERRLQKFRDKPRTAEQQNPRIRTDKRRGHGSEHDQNLQQLPTFDFVDIVQVCKRHADDETNDRNAYRNFKTVEQRNKIIRIAEKLFKISERKRACRIVAYGLRYDF